jgi:hypothetical protein
MTRQDSALRALETIEDLMRQAARLAHSKPLEAASLLGRAMGRLTGVRMDINCMAAVSEDRAERLYGDCLHAPLMIDEIPDYEYSQLEKAA